MVKDGLIAGGLLPIFHVGTIIAVIVGGFIGTIVGGMLNEKNQNDKK